MARQELQSPGVFLEEAFGTCICSYRVEGSVCVLVQAGARCMKADTSYSRGETFPEIIQKRINTKENKNAFLPTVENMDFLTNSICDLILCSLIQ